MSAETDRLTEALARQVIGEVAPEELPLFDPVCSAWFATRRSGRRQRRRQEDPLGFGPETAATILAPAVLAVCGEVARHLAGEVERSIAGRISKLVGRAVGWLLARPRTPSKAAPPAELTRDQLVRVRQLAFERGLEVGLPRERASVLADAIAGSLVLTGRVSEGPAVPAPD
jgi:hypothetical protein